MRYLKLGGLLTGPLVALSFPDAGVTPLALVAFLPLLWAIRDLTWGKRLLLGIGAGTLGYLGVLYSLAHLLQSMSGFSAGLAWLSFLGVSLYHGLHWGLFALAAEPLRRRWPGRAWLTLPTLLVGLDLIFPQLFPYFLGSAATPMLPLAQVLDLVGVHGLTWLLVAAQVLLLEIARIAWTERRLARRPALALALGLAAVLTYGFVRLAQVRGAPAGPPLGYVMVQPNYTAAQRRAGDAATMQAMGAGLLGQLRTLGPGEADLVLLPEGGFPFPYPSFAAPPGAPPKPAFRFVTRLAEEARRLRAHLIFGAQRYPAPDAQPRNSLVHLGPDGRIRAIYDKVRLVPFGERMPFAWLRRSVSGFEDLAPGTQRRPFRVAGHLLAPSICYEAIFSADMQEAVSAASGIRILLNATNDVWFGTRTNAAALHLALQRPRAIENRVVLLRAANTGISAVIGPDGAVSRTTEVGTPQVVRGTVHPPAIFSLYRHIGLWWFALPLGACVALLGWSLARRRPRSRGRKPGRR